MARDTAIAPLAAEGACRYVWYRLSTGGMAQPDIPSNEPLRVYMNR